MSVDRLKAVRSLLNHFATSTGLIGDRTPRRYLWTDAHAVCAYLSLHKHSPNAPNNNLHLAAKLIDQVHSILGKHHPQDPRKGWLSGLSEQDGAKNPTSGGLRIGKQYPERSIGERYDAKEEWDRDGQYYHYLTKWMHALHQMAIVCRDERYYRWAVELAIVAHRGFRVEFGGRLYWKMSCDLSRELVASSGLHDPLDGYVTALTLASSSMSSDGVGKGLEMVIDDLGRMCVGRRWDSDDSLGIGGLLFDAYRLSILVDDWKEDGLFKEVCAAAETGLIMFSKSSALRRPPELRLAFRELGLAIGIHAAEKIKVFPRVSEERVEVLRKHFWIAGAIEEFWLRNDHQHCRTWTEHQDINEVMLAVSLSPEGFIGR